MSLVYDGILFLPEGIKKDQPSGREQRGSAPWKTINACHECGKLFEDGHVGVLCPQCKARIDAEVDAMEAGGAPNGNLPKHLTRTTKHTAAKTHGSARPKVVGEWEQKH